MIANSLHHLRGLCHRHGAILWHCGQRGLSILLLLRFSPLRDLRIETAHDLLEP